MSHLVSWALFNSLTASFSIRAVDLQNGRSHRHGIHCTAVLAAHFVIHTKKRRPGDPMTAKPPQQLAS